MSYSVLSEVAAHLPCSVEQAVERVVVVLVVVVLVVVVPAVVRVVFVLVVVQVVVELAAVLAAEPFFAPEPPAAVAVPQSSFPVVRSPCGVPVETFSSVQLR